MPRRSKSGPRRRPDDEPPSMASLECYDEDGVYLGPSPFESAKVFRGPEAKEMRRRMRRGGLKGKKEEDSLPEQEVGYPEAETDDPVSHAGRSGKPAAAASRRVAPPLLGVERVIGNSQQAGLLPPLPGAEARSPSPASPEVPRDPNARSVSPAAPLGTLEPPRGRQMLRKLGACAVLAPDTEVGLCHREADESESEETEPETLETPNFDVKSREDLDNLMKALHAQAASEKVSEESGFCYAKELSPYHLVPCPRREEDEHWVVVGESGLMYCSAGGIEDFISYEEHFRERQLFRRMRRLKWAQRFQVCKCFAQWSENARRQAFEEAQGGLEDRLFLLNATTQHALLWLQRFSGEKFHRLTALDADLFGAGSGAGTRPKRVGEYAKALAQGCAGARKVALALDEGLEKGLAHVCAVILRPQLEAERALAEEVKAQVDGLHSLFPATEAEVGLGFPEQVTAAMRARLQRECHRIWRFIRLCTFLVEGRLRDMARKEVQRLTSALLSSPRSFARGEEWRTSGRTPTVRRRALSGQLRELKDIVFQLDLTGTEQIFSRSSAEHLAVTPKAEEICSWVLQALSSSVHAVQSLRIPTCSKALRLYHQVASANGLTQDELPHWPCYELSKDILDEEASQALFQVLERLESAFQQLAAIEAQLQVLARRYVAAVALNDQGTGEPLLELHAQTAQVAAARAEAAAMQEQHLVQGLVLDCSTFREDLLKGSQELLDALTLRVQDAIEASAQPVWAWTSQHERRVAEPPPPEIERFLLHLEEVEKLEREFPYYKRQVQQMRQLEDLAEEIGSPLESQYGTAVRRAKEQVDNFERELLENLHWIKVSSERFLRQLDEEKPKILQQLDQFITELCEPELLTLRSTLFGELEADDMAPSKALLLAEHRGEDLKFEFRDEQEWECITSRQVELRDRQRQLTELEALVEDWSSKHRALQVDDPGCEEKLSEAQNTLGPLLEIWSACATFLEVLTYCGETEISMLDEERAAKCQEMAEQFEDLPPVCLCEELQTRCEILQEVLSIARMLEDFQEAHWEQMEGSVDKWNIQTVKDIQSRLESSDSLLLEDLVALKLLNVREELQAVHKQAVQQKEIREQMQELQSRWGRARLLVERKGEAKEEPLSPGKRRNSVSLTEARAVYNGLQNGRTMLEELEQSMIAAALLLSKAEGGTALLDELLKQVLGWHTDLVKMQEVLQDWLKLQKLRVKLRFVYNLPEVRDAKQDQVLELNAVENWWQSLMASVEARPLLAKVLLQPELHPEILEKTRALERLQEGMHTIFARKRSQCARLNFLVDSDILDLMRQAQDKVLVSATGEPLDKDGIAPGTATVMREDVFLLLEIHKCFDGMEQLVMRPGLDETLCGMRSWEKEMVSFGRLKLVTKIEALVTLVQDAMIKALRSHLARATLHRETKHEGTSVERRVTHDFDRLEWCSDTRLCAQAILLCEQTAWCKAVEMALLTEDHAERELRNLRRNEAGHLMRLLDHLRSSAEPPSPLHRLRLERLVLQQLRSQEALRLLLSTKGRFHREMLPWQMQLRLESPSASVKHLRLRHLEYCADYGFEYQGLSFRMVVTPQTERCWLAITQAFAQGMAPVVCGAAGEGKSQTLKDLAMEQGVFCPLLACSESTSAADLSRVLVGLAGHSSCWVALEQTEALQPGLLSLLLGLFQRLRSLLVQDEQKQWDINFEGHRLKPRRAPLALLLSSSAPLGATSKTLGLREVALLPPDLHQITEVLLFLRGFEQHAAQTGAARLAEFFRHASAWTSVPVTLHFLRTALDTAGEDSEQAMQHAFGKVLLQVPMQEQVALKRLLQELFSTTLQPQADLADRARRRLSFVKEPSDSETSDSSASEGVQSASRSSASSKSVAEEEEEAEEELEEASNCPSEVFAKAMETDADFTAQLDKEVQRQHLAVSSAWSLAALQLHRALSHFPGLVLCGASGTGKSTLLRAVMAVEKLLARQKDLQPRELLVYFPKDGHELLSAGTSAVRGSLLPQLLRGHKVLCLDGPLQPWAESLNGLLDGTTAGLRQVGNAATSLGHSRLLFETDTLASASPGTLCRCSLVLLSPETLGAVSLLRHWHQTELPHLAPWLPPEAQQELLRLLELFPEACALRGGGSAACAEPSLEAQLLSNTLLKLLRAQLKAVPRAEPAVMPGQLATGRRLSTSTSLVLTAHSKRDLVASNSIALRHTKAGDMSFDYVRYIRSCFVFSLTWTIALSPFGVPPSQLLSWVQAKMGDFHLPRGCHRLTDVFVDWCVQDSEVGYLSPWFTQLPVQLHESRGRTGHEEAVATVHLMSFSFVAFSLLQQGAHVLVSGVPGCGKSLAASSAEQSLRSLRKWTTMSTVLSRSSRGLGTLLATAAEQRCPGRQLVPGELLLRVEDVNLPQRPTPHELLRSFLENALRDKNLVLHGAEGIRVLASTCAPSWGHNFQPQPGSCGLLPSRLQRHFSELFMPEPPEEDVKKILQTISRQILKVHGPGDSLVAAFAGAEEPLQGLKLKAEDALALASLQLFKAAKDAVHRATNANLASSAFSLRSLGRVLQGVARGQPWQFTLRRQLARLWVHESLRVFEDRWHDTGRKIREQMTQLALSHFGVDLVLDTGSGPLFAMDALYDGQYRDFDEQDVSPARALQEAVNAHNATAHPKGALVFLPFAQSVLHALRTARVLSTAGHLVMLGPEGCGKRSALRAGCCLAKASCVDLLAGCAFAPQQEAFFSLLRSCVVSAACGQRQLLLFSLTQLPYLQDLLGVMMDFLHGLVRHGDVEEAFGPEHRSAALQAANIPEEAEAWVGFLRKARPRLHGALCGTANALGVWARRLPGLVTCTDVDYFSPLNEEAFQGIISAVTGIERDLSDKNCSFSTRQVAAAVSVDEDQLDFVLENEPFCTSILAAVDALPAVQQMAEGTSLRGFLDLLGAFTASCTAQIARLRALRAKLTRNTELLMQVVQQVALWLGPLQDWLDKRKALREEVAEGTKKAAEMQEEVRSKHSEIQQDEERKAAADALVRTSMQAYEGCRQMAAEAKSRYEARLATVCDTLQDDQLVVEMNFAQQESFIVQEILACFCAVLGLNHIRGLWRLPEDGVLPARLRELDLESVPKECIKELEGLHFSHVPCISELANVAAEAVVHYLRSLADLLRLQKHERKAADVLFEEEERQAEIKARLTLALQASRILQDTLADLKAKLTHTRVQLQEAEEVIQSSAEKVARAERYKLPAERLIEAWEQQRMELRLEPIPGRSLLHSAALSFLGPLEQPQREALQQRLASFAGQSFGTLELLSNEAVRMRRRLGGLAETQQLSAAIAKAALAWPFCLDPHQQAQRWLDAELRDAPAIKASDPKILQKIERAVAGECAIVVQGCAGTPPVLLPQMVRPGKEGMMEPEEVAEPDVRKSQLRRMSMQRLTGPAIPSGQAVRRFQIYMTSGVSSASDLPAETQAVCAVVSFALTLEGFTGLCLDELLRLEVPGMEPEFRRLYGPKAWDESACLKAEESLLQLLTESRGSAITDSELVTSALSAHATAQTQLQAAREKVFQQREDFQKARGRLLALAEPLALVLESCQALCKLKPLYVPSLAQVFSQLSRSLSTGQRLAKIMEEKTWSEETLEFLESLRQRILFEALEFLMRPFEQQHRLVFAFLTAVGLARLENRLSEFQLQLFWQGHAGVESITAALNEERRKNAQEGETPAVINPRFVKSSPDRKAFPGEKWELINFLPKVFPGFRGLPEDLLLNIAQWRQALCRRPLGGLHACRHFPEPWCRRRPRNHVLSFSGEGSEKPKAQGSRAPSKAAQADSRAPSKATQEMYIQYEQEMNWEGLSSFEQLLLLKVLQPDFAVHAVRGFVAEELGESVLDIQPLLADQAVEELQEFQGQTRPLLLVLPSASGGASRSILDELKVIVERRRQADARRSFQLLVSSALRESCLQSVREAAAEGAILVVTELQLASEHWLGCLELLMEELCMSSLHVSSPERNEGPVVCSSVSRSLSAHVRESRDFRLILCVEGFVALPTSMLQMCQKVAVLPPSGVRTRLRQLAQRVDWEPESSPGRPSDERRAGWRRNLFSLCLFHAVLCERSRYNCFYAAAYDFGAYSFRSACSFMRTAWSQESDPPWDLLLHFIRTQSHGAQVAESWDRQQLGACMLRFMGPAAGTLALAARLAHKEEGSDSEEERQSAELQTLRARCVSQYLDFQLDPELPGSEAAAKCITELPEATTAELFGCHPREDKALDAKRSDQVLSLLAALRPAAEAGASDIQQLFKVEDLLSELPVFNPALDQEIQVSPRGKRSLERRKEATDPLLAQVLRQELFSLRELLAKLRRDLRRLHEMMSAKLQLSEDMQELLDHILANSMPDAWRRISFPSARPLASWAFSLKMRLQWLEAAWSEMQARNEPFCWRLDLFWRPQQLLLSSLRSFCSQKLLPLAQCSFRHKVLAHLTEEEDVQDRPSSGLYICGPFLRGASWDRRRGALVDGKMDEFFYRMPVMHFIPTKDQRQLRNRCPVPFFQADRGPWKSNGRDANFIAQVFLHAADPNDWLLKGVALFCEAAS